MTRKILRKRTISIHKLEGEKAERDIKRLLAFQPGIESIRIDREKKRVYVEYNLLDTNYAGIEEIMRTIGFPPNETFAQHLKDTFIKFAEENELAHIESHAEAFSYSPMEQLDEELDKKKR